MIEFDAYLDFGLSENALLTLAGLQDYGPVQTAVDNAVVRYMIPYWAYDTGRLAHSGYSSDIGSGIIEYDTPYARWMYYGVYDSGRPVNYRTAKNPQAGAFPFERMKADHMTDILEEAKASVTG